MDNQSNSSRKVDIGHLIKDVFCIYKNNLPLMINYVLAYGFTSIFSDILLNKLGVSQSGISILINVFLTSIVSIALIFASDKLFDGKNIDFIKSFESLKGRYFLFVTVSMASMLIMGVGILLFIVPGIYFATIFIFSDILVVLDKVTLPEAFQKSALMVKSVFWSIFRFNMTLVMILISPMLIIQPISATNPQLGQTINLLCMSILVPFYIMAQVNLYKIVKSLQN